MKIIDFHTHTFPDAIAEKTIQVLSGKSRTTPFLSSKAADLAEDGKKNGIDLSVVLPVVTNPLKTRKINDASALINETTAQTGLFSFGGMHPDTPDPKEEIKHIAELGLKGFKVHPAYQQVKLNDIRFKRMAGYAEEYGLVMLTHGGLDIGIEGDWSSPAMCKELLKEVKPTKFVMAHLGGWNQWDDVEELLCGENVYLDTAFAYGQYAYQADVAEKDKVSALEGERLCRIIRLHGADKIVFGTDSPWANRPEQVELYKDLPLTDREKDQIFHLTAEKLLSI